MAAQRTPELLSARPRTPPRPRGSLRRLLTGPVGGTLLTVTVAGAVFAGVLPRMADYADAWGLVRDLTAGETAIVAAAAVVNLLTYAPVWMAALPGLRLSQAILSDQASTAVSNTVPAGFAVGVGTNAAMFHSFGFSAAQIARAVAVTGIWNNLVKFGLPALALGGVALVADVPPGLAVAAALGSVLLLLVVAALIAIVTHRAAGAVAARLAERLVGGLARAAGRQPPTGWPERAERFRTDSLELLRGRWAPLTVTAVVSHAALFVLLLVCLRTVDGEGAEVHWLAVLAVFAVTRLVTAVPITPGALGVAELSYVAGLTAVGVSATGAAAAVLVFRLLTWFLPIPCGLVAWIAWRRGAGQADPAAP
ncbi:YbhN family protein [Blastococcus sp. TF02A-26]|uniref:lysylphosphatidylglycerol synthase transmembrane domain-containing protein n=1 Tax=Blastococcus sp. TF02A-26 TaxID=2250577 RepID=UPI0011BE4BAF|nr:YbhN family protein [Blastococcus sp. TF02A-26]